MEYSPNTNSFNLPNTLSVIRAILAIIVPILWFQDAFVPQLLGTLVFFIGAMTDILDGIYARRYGLITTFGKIMDPIADKLLMLVAMVTLAIVGIFPYWVVIPIAIREIGVTVTRFYFLYRGTAIAAVKSGKQKTVLQAVAIIAAFVSLMYQAHVADLVMVSLRQPIGWFCLAVTYVALTGAFYQTMYSGYDFLRLNWHKLTQ